MKTLKTLLAASAVLMSVKIMASERKVWPEALADSLSSDGVGYVDLGYKYHMSSFPKTARIVCQFYNHDWGNSTGVTDGPVLSTKLPRTVFGYQDAPSGCMSVARINGGKAEFYYGAWKSANMNCGRKDSIATIDYLNASASWYYQEDDKTLEFTGVTAPIKDATGSYYLFANNVCTGENRWQGIYKFKNLRIYELTESGEEECARDYVPCFDKGRFGVYDKVSGGIFLVENDIGAFSAENIKWRLTVGEEVRFVSGIQSVAAPDGVEADGWMLIKDSDGTLCAQGKGSLASFSMPEAGVTLRWVRDEEIAAGEVRAISSAEYVGTLTVAADSVLSFTHGGVLFVSEGVVRSEGARINVGLSDVAASGTYELIKGNIASLSLSAFQLVALPSGLEGSFERRGDAICLRISGTASEVALLPDKMVDTLTSDGSGYVDLGYRHRATSFPKTAKIVCDIWDGYWGRGLSNSELILPESTPRTVFGYQQSGSSVSIARYNGGSNFYFINQNWAQSGGGCGRLDTSITIDYINQCGSVAYSENDGRTLNVANVKAPTSDSEVSYHLFANSAPTARYQGLFKFKNLRVYELADEATEILARNFVPAFKDGKPCVYDTVTKAILPVLNEGTGFKTAGCKWPQDVFASITQDFPCARTQSFRPVAVPEFAPERIFTFTADGSVELKRAVATATMVAYAVDGSVISTKTQSNLNAGDQLEVEVGTASKTVLTLTGVTVPEVKSVIQEFDVASVQSCDGVAFRRTGKHECEFMLPADATISFSVAVDEIFADDYSDVGELTGVKRLYGHVDAGEAVDVDSGDGAYRVLRVKLSHPRFRFIVR